MQGGKNKQLPLGYTIVEVMIFLAISGFMFILAVAFISGKQATAEFKQGMSAINNQITTIINDVNNGYYPSEAQQPCVPSTTGPSFTGAGTQIQGANQGCVFLGKVIQFGVNGTGSSGSGWSGYDIYTIAGNQYSDGSVDGSAVGGQLASNFDGNGGGDVGAQPQIVPGITQVNALEWGLRVTEMYSINPSNKIGAIGFFGSFGQYNTGSSSLQSSAQSVNLIVLPSSKLGQSSISSSDISDANASSSQSTSPNIVICFQGSNGQVGSITIGSMGQRLATTVDYGGSKCP